MSNENELIVNIPLCHVTGEPGDPLSPTAVSIIMALVCSRYWPLDFGDTTVMDDGGEFLELIFLRAASVAEAQENAQSFILRGGAA